MIPAGLLMAFGPGAVLHPLGAEWELEMIRWSGSATLILAWAIAAGHRRGLLFDATTRAMVGAGLSGNAVGIVLGAPGLVVVGLSFTIGAACRAGVQLGADVQTQTLRRLQG